MSQKTIRICDHCGGRISEQVNAIEFSGEIVYSKYEGEPIGSVEVTADNKKDFCTKQCFFDFVEDITLGYKQS